MATQEFPGVLAPQPIATHCAPPALLVFPIAKEPADADPSTATESAPRACALIPSATLRAAVAAEVAPIATLSAAAWT